MKVTTQPNTKHNGPRYVTKELNYNMFDKMFKEILQ